MMMHGGSRQIDLLDPIIDKEISHQADSSGGLSAEDKENISNLYMEVFLVCGFFCFVFFQYLDCIECV